MDTREEIRPAEAWPPTDIPSVLYRYDSVDHAKQVLAESQLYLCSPASFNDPFDCRIWPSFEGSKEQFKRVAAILAKRKRPAASRKERRRMVKSARPQLNRDSFEKIFAKWQRDILDNCGMLCLTENREDILMWSHYARGHTGVCLEFRFGLGPDLCRPPLPVIYRDRIPDFSFTEIFAKLQGGDLLEFAKLVFLTKASHWKYEREWRLIDFPLEGLPRYGLRRFSAHLLTGIIVGCRIEEHEKRAIFDLASKRSPRPTIFQAKTRGREFGLDVEEVRF